MSDDATGTPEPRWPLPGVALGCDYNPEQRPESVWAEDMRLMKQAGVGFATVGVFSRALLQPGPDRYSFDRLDRVLDLLAANGVAADLATATSWRRPGTGRRAGRQPGGGAGRRPVRLAGRLGLEPERVPAITRNHLGAGVAWYVGTWPDDALVALLDRVRTEAGVHPPVEAPEGLAEVRRRGAASSHLFVLNHTVNAVTISANGYDLVSESQVVGRLTVRSGGIAVVREVD